MTNPRTVSKSHGKVRMEAAKALRKLLDENIPRKQAFMIMGKRLKALGLPCTKRTLYSWCAEYSVSLK